MTRRAREFMAISLVSLVIGIFGGDQSFSAMVVATGTLPDACNQNVTISDSVTAVRSGQDCIVSFTNTSETIWTVPYGISSISAVVVAGGGGGGDSAAGVTGGGGGAGGFFSSNYISVSGTIAILAGSGGAGSNSTSQGGTGGNSYLGTLKVGGGGGGNGYNYTGGLKAQAGVGGSDFVSSGSGGGGRSRNAGTGNESQGNSGGTYAASGITFLGATYTGIQGGTGNNAWSGDLASGGLGGSSTPDTARTSSITGTSVIYSKVSDFRPWGDAQSTAGTKTPGSGGSPNYGYGTDVSTSGGNAANGIVIIRYTLPSTTWATLSIQGGAVVYRTAQVLTVKTSTAGLVDFKANGKYIPGCRSIVSNLGNSYSSVCNYRPSTHGQITISAVFRPTDNAFSNSSATLAISAAAQRSGKR